MTENNTGKKRKSALETLSSTNMVFGAPLMSLPQKWIKNNPPLVLAWAGGVVLFTLGAVGWLISTFSNKENKKQASEQPTLQNNAVIIPQTHFDIDSSQKKEFLATIRPQSLHDYAETKNQTLEK